MNEKAKKALDAAADQIGAAYVFGAWGASCTPEERRRRADLRPAYADKIRAYCPVLSGRATTCDGCKYSGRRCFDCRGLTRWVLQAAGITISGEGATSQWETRSNWAKRGAIANGVPALPLLILFRGVDGGTMSHTGVYVGSAHMIHARGHAVGVVLDTLGDGVTMTHWAIPAGMYTAQEIEEAGVAVITILKYGASGDAVKKLQTMLNAAGFDCGNVDGKYGAATRAAVERLQTVYHLEADGVYGPATAAVLEAIFSGHDQDPETIPEKDQEQTPVEDPEAQDQRTTYVCESIEDAAGMISAVLSFLKGGTIG